MEASSYPAAAPEHIIAAVKNLEDVSERMEMSEQPAAAAPELAEMPSRESERWAEKSGGCWRVGGLGAPSADVTPWGQGELLRVTAEEKSLTLAMSEPLRWDVYKLLSSVYFVGSPLEL